MNNFYSNKSLIKKINFLLSTVNLSLTLLSGLSKRRVYKLLKKAQKINKNLFFEKKELKSISKLISEIKLISKNETKILRRFLKLKDTKKSVQNIDFSLEFKDEIFQYEFINKKQVMIC